MKRLFICLFAFMTALLTCFGQEVKVGDTLPVWQEGELDIHFISTGRGDCTFMVFPDGTTFLTDASGSVTKKFAKGQVAGAKWKPNDSATLGQVLADYISFFSPAVSDGHINYFLLTLHLREHMGEYWSDAPSHYSGDFRLTSLCELGSILVFDNMYDRDYPNFSYPKNASGGMMSNYKNFLRWTKEKNGTNVEKWDVGSSRQIVPLHNKSYDITVRNIAGNGCVATGKEGESLSYMPSKAELATLEKEAYPDENCFSCAYMLSYGKFDFFLGGDLRHRSRDKYPYMDGESPLANAVHKVEVMQADSHGGGNSNASELVDKLAPDVWVVSSWRQYGQPSGDSMERVLNANPNCDVFCTYQTNEGLGKLVARLGIDAVKNRMVSRYGHVVVRVANGGDSYMIYTLEDSNEDYVVKSIHGPYICH